MSEFQKLESPNTSAIVTPVQEPSQASHQIKPRSLLYFCWLTVLIAPLQFGYMVSELNLSKFNDDEKCKRPVPDGECLVFPAHTKTAWTLVVNAWVAGGCIGSFFSNVPATKFGRRGAHVFTAIVMIVGGALQAFSPAIWMLILGRFVSGVASGIGLAVSSVYVSEIAPAHLRGSLGAGVQLGLVSGILLADIVLFGAGSGNAWRYVVGFPIVMGGLLIAGCMMFVVESPRWLLSNGGREAAYEAYSKLYGPEGADIAMSDVDAAAKNDAEEDTDEEDNGEAKQSPWKLLFTEYSVPLIAAGGVAAVQQLSGCNAVFYYSSGIFKDAGLSDDRVGTLIVGLVNALSTFAAASVMNKFPRRKLLFYSAVGMLICSIGMTIAFITGTSILAILFTALYVAAFEMGLGPIPYMLMPELFPNHMRAAGMSMCSFINWASNLLVGVTFPYISDALTKSYAFVPFIVLLVLSCIFIHLRVPETTGKTLEQIQEELGCGKKKNNANNNNNAIKMDAKC